MKKTCAVSGKEFEITEEDLKFYEKMGVPVPALCPEERAKRRLIFRPHKLYRRQCDATKKPLISCCPPTSKHKVYERNYWWSEQWDPFQYGRDFDFNRPFFDQFKELFFEVPIPHQYGYENENSDYCNGLGWCRNCYLGFNMDGCEDCCYIFNGKFSRDCVDCDGVTKCEICYECQDCDTCYNLLFGKRCTGCRDSMFLLDCRQCSNCLGCVNLSQKNYYILNQKVSQEEFEAKKKELEDYDALQKFKQEFKKLVLSLPKKYYYGYGNENFSGDNIFHVKNSYHCFYSEELENCKYCNYVYESNNCQDYDYFGKNSAWIYNCLATGENCTNNVCCMMTWKGSSDNYYCQLISGTSNCFGCAGLRQKKYCILNKQYSREEYEALVPKIIEHMKSTGEWGNFFPREWSSWSYNETAAGEHYPLEKEEALAEGWNWVDPDKKITNAKKIIRDPSVLPATISEVPDAALEYVICCEVSGQPFKIQKSELEFYRKTNLPLPRKHPDVRHAEKVKAHNPYLIFDRTCDKCGTDIQTTFAPKRPEKVFCEKCYLEIVN